MATRKVMARNLPNTQAFLTLRLQTQAVFDFIVTVSYGVAALRRQLQLLDKGVITALPLPDGFHPNNTPDQLREMAKVYKQQLAASSFLSLFSYFEAFVKNIIRETVSFHGGADALKALAERHDREFIREEYDLEKLKRRVRRKREPGRVDQHEKYTRELLKLGYRFPSELFSTYGVRMLIQKVENLRAADIPDILTHGLHMPIDQSALEAYNEARETRNRIAHGTHVPLSIRDVAQKNDVLRRLSVELDRHINLYFMISEESLK